MAVTAWRLTGRHSKTHLQMVPTDRTSPRDSLQNGSKAQLHLCPLNDARRCHYRMKRCCRCHIGRFQDQELLTCSSCTGKLPAQVSPLRASTKVGRRQLAFQTKRLADLTSRSPIPTMNRSPWLPLAPVSFASPLPPGLRPKPLWQLGSRLAS